MAKGVRDPGLRIVLLSPQNPTDKGPSLQRQARFRFANNLLRTPVETSFTDSLYSEREAKTA